MAESTVSEIEKCVLSAIKADLRNISKVSNQINTDRKEIQQQATKFLEILVDSSMNLMEKIEKVIKPCIRLICGFVHNLSKENISKESIMNRLISNCKLTVYILIEIFMYPNNSFEMMIDEGDSMDVNSQIASYFGLYDELVSFMIMFSFDESFLESLTLVNPIRFANIKVEDSQELMYHHILKRIFNWVCVTSVEDEIQSHLSPLGYEIIVKHLIHSVQHVLFKSVNRRFNSGMRVTKYWFRVLWEHDSSLFKPHIVELLKRMFQVMKVKRSNDYHSNFTVYMGEVISSLVAKEGDGINPNEFGRFIMQTLKSIIWSPEELEGKNQAILMYYNLLIDDIDTFEDDAVVKSLLDLLFDKVLFTEKNSDCRITAMEVIQKVVVDSKLYKRVNTNRQQLIMPLSRIFNQIAHVLKFDPNQGVRNKSFELWLSLFDMNQDSNYLILVNMLHIKSRDKEKKIRVRAFEKVSEIGISKLNQNLIYQMKNQEEYVEPIVSNKSLKLTRVVRSKKVDESMLVCEQLREILIIGMLDDEKRVRDLSEQLFVELVQSEMNPLALMKELEQSYHQIIRVTTDRQRRSQVASCWAIFEGVLKGSINNLYITTN